MVGKVASRLLPNETPAQCLQSCFSEATLEVASTVSQLDDCEHESNTDSEQKSNTDSHSARSKDVYTRGISTGLASSVSSSRTAARTPSKDLYTCVNYSKDSKHLYTCDTAKTRHLNRLGRLYARANRPAR